MKLAPSEMAASCCGGTPRSSRVAAAGLALALLLWAGGCHDDRIAGPEPPDTTATQMLVVSDPVQVAGTIASTPVAASGRSALDPEFVYVSLRPGAIPDGRVATITNPRTGASLTTGVVAGGLDPVPMEAATGDTLEMEVKLAAGGAQSFALAVPASRRPVVVRTDPPPRKRDVALNARLVIVFSEPVAGSTLTPASIRLLQAGTSVGGTVRFLDPTLDATRVSVEFVPTVALAAQTEYQLVVTRQVSDLSGDALAAPDTALFTTGSSFTGPPASIRLAPDSTLGLVNGATYQLTATVHDAAGNVLTDQPVTWSSSDPNGLTVSSTGLVTAQAEGFYLVTASVGSLSKLLIVYVGAGAPASVTIAPTPATVTAGDTIILAATVRDAAGRAINSPSVTWTSSALAVATVVPFSADTVGLVFATVSGVSTGSATITATSGVASGTAAVTVMPPQPVALVTVTPNSATLVVQGAVQLAAALRDANNRVISGRPIAWASDNPAVVTVDANGLVTGIGQGSAAVTATSEAVSGSAAITVTVISFVSVHSPRGNHSCGVTTGGAAYCWGGNQYGQLGDGSTTRSTVPAAVAGELAFTSIGSGWYYTCGLTASGAAYCWGNWAPGSSSAAPVAVPGGLTFAMVSAGSFHTCGVTNGGAAYCWGMNLDGRLGDGSTTSSAVPVAVAGGLTFALVIAGENQTCGLTTNGSAYCWGGNPLGELGDGSTTARSTPVAVAGGLTFAAVSAGSGHTCGVTTGGAAYCWGYNSLGQLGDGSNATSAVPVAVGGGLTFASVSAGIGHTCGVTTGGAAYCWGANYAGQFGNGSVDFNVNPLPVPAGGGLSWTSVSAGNSTTCGVTTTAIAYCWGENLDGQIGNGTRTDSTVPAKVAGQP